jgi:uncharacterized protein (TIGR03067 family)
MISLQDGGRTAPQAVIEGMKWVITDAKITYLVEGNTTEMSYVLDPTKTPKWIDFTERRAERAEPSLQRWTNEDRGCLRLPACACRLLR